MDFFATETLEPSTERLDALRNVGRLVSQAIQRIREKDAQAEAAADNDAVNQVLAAVQNADTVDAAVRFALDTVKEAFGWAYGSYWYLDTTDKALKFMLESGSVNEEFRRATETAAFQEGVGLSGRTWKQRDLFFVKDIGEMTDCCRAPVAQRAGVKSGVCFPVIVHGEIVGTMDFFATETLSPSQSRLDALRNVGRLVSQALERIQDAQTLREKVDQLLEVVNAAAKGDLTKHVTFSGTDAVGELAGGLEKMLNDLRGIIGQVVESSNQFAEGARVISESSQTLASGAQTQSSSVEQMTASIEELTRSVEAVKDNANDANKLAQDANQMAEDGGKAVQRSVEGMEKIRQSSTQIAEIIQVISEIASQTNLLALNAAIEAARAGEHGMGFAVVADEVRKLAERSNQAAGEISTLIRESTEQVEQGAQLSEETGESLKRIIEGVESTAAKINEIATATVEQATNAQEVSQAIQGVAEVTEQSAAGSEEMASSSEELGAQANTLRELVQRFRVESAAGAY
jgi:methyl-accepting chemotaxis protein